jgi:L-threonylcarbamoyladenylate synthase
MQADIHKIVRVDPVTLEFALIQRGARVIRDGGTVVFPTSGLYGLAADATNPGAIAKVFAIKRRPETTPLLVLIGESTDIESLAVSIPPKATVLMAKIWPGRITIILEARPDLPAGLTAGTGKIGIRLPGHPVAIALTKAAGVPITGTSANVSGRNGFSRIDHMDKEILQGTDLILDAGKLKGGRGSTVIDMTADKPKILREGAVPEREIRAILEA